MSDILDCFHTEVCFSLQFRYEVLLAYLSHSLGVSYFLHSMSIVECALLSIVGCVLSTIASNISSETDRPTDTWGQLVSTTLNHKTCINTSRQVLEKTLFAINAIFTQDNNLSKPKVDGSLQKTKATCSNVKQT